MPQLNRRTSVKKRVTCTLCDWTKTVASSKAEQSLQGHIGYAHMQGTGQGRQPRQRKGIYTNKDGQKVMRTGMTKKSRANVLRLTDGRDHPVDVRQIQGRQTSGREAT